MARVVRPWQVLLAALAGWVNQHQQALIDYLREENRVLRSSLATGGFALAQERGVTVDGSQDLAESVIEGINKLVDRLRFLLLLG